MNQKTSNILAIICGFLMGAFFICAGIWQYNQSRQLADHGKTVTGIVLNTEERIVGVMRVHSYFVEVRYQPENQTTRDQNIATSRAVYEQTHKGDSVKVHYMPDDLNVCQVGEQVEIHYKAIVLGGGSILAALVLIVLFKHPISWEQAAENINETVKFLALEKYEYASAKPEDFKHLDLTYYNQMQKSLESRDFVYIEDKQNMTMRQRPGIRTFWRTMLSADRTMQAAFYHFIPRLRLRLLNGKKPARVLDFTTSLSDGSFISTSNAPGASKFEYPPILNKVFMRPNTAWDMLLDTHIRRVDKYLASHPGTKAVVIGGKEDIQRISDEIQRIKSEFRKEHGLSKIELERIARRSDPEVDRLHEAIVKNREQNK